MATPKYNIEIDGFIGELGYSKTYVAKKLNECLGKTALVRLNSMGGNLDHGLNIAARFSEHGKVQADLFGFNASASTLASLGAKNVRMSSSGLYLIHKVMNVVDIFGRMNADEMAQAIEELTTNMEENNKIDQVIAQMYADKTGKPMEEMLTLMKIGGWLNAHEAKTWGFVDEIIPTKEKMNFKGLEEKFNAFGLPIHRINTENLFTTKNKIEMKKQFIKVNAVIGVDKLESTDEEGIYLNVEQLESIDTNITTLENSIVTEKANVATQSDRTNAAELIANTAQAKVATQETEIADLKTQITNLNKGAGDKTNQSTQETDDKGKGKDKLDAYSNAVAESKKLYDLLPD